MNFLWISFNFFEFPVFSNCSLSPLPRAAGRWARGTMKKQYIQEKLRKFKEIEKEYLKSGKNLYLNRNYNIFIWGIESWGEECEFNQIQTFYNIDLSPLRMFNYGGLGTHCEEIDGWKDWELSKVSKQKDIDRINFEYQEKLKIVTAKDEYDFENNWIETQTVKQTIKNLISQINVNPSKVIELNSHYYSPETFKMNRQNHKKNQYYILDDFEHIIDFADFAESKNENMISFCGG